MAQITADGVQAVAHAVPVLCPCCARAVPMLQPVRKLTEQEQWEARQLANSGVVQVDELPTYDHESGEGFG